MPTTTRATCSMARSRRLRVWSANSRKSVPALWSSRRSAMRKVYGSGGQVQLPAGEFAAQQSQHLKEIMETRGGQGLRRPQRDVPKFPEPLVEPRFHGRLIARHDGGRTR